MSRKFVLALAALALAAGPATASGPSAARLGSAPRLPLGARLIGSLSGSTPLRVTVTLQPRDPAALQAYATEVSTPGSSLYRRFLSVADFRARFAPTDASIASVTASLRAHGLSPGAASANGLAIPVMTTVGMIERAFSVALDRVALPGGRTAYANAQAPLLDSSVAGLVQGVVGLDDLALPRPLSLIRGSAALRPRVTRHVVTGGPQPCSTATSAGSSNHTYTTDQIASAYGFSGLYGAGDLGAGQTVAIYELEGNFPSDISAYESCYGINASVSYSQVDGGPSAPNPNPPSFDGIETELDIENVIGLAPKANVLVYQGPNNSTNTLPGSGPYDVYQTIISQDKAQVISSSWGECESQDGTASQQAENTLFQEAATQGESVFAASGDSGSEDCTNGNGVAQPGLAADDPATQPFVTSTGGTHLATLGPPPTETVWNDPATAAVCGYYPTPLPVPVPTACGGGGGISDFWKMPSYQTSTPGVINSDSSGTPCGATAGGYCREVPDVAADADPATGYTIYYDGDGTATDSTAWQAVGGTSAAAPLWAALMADTNASAACHGSAIGFANPALYGTAAHEYAGRFNDVVSGNNDILGSSGGLYPAGPGYDMASGLGTPNATGLAAALCMPTVAVTAPGAQRTRIHRRVAVQVSASDSSDYALSYSASGLPKGLWIGPRTGRISGTPKHVGFYRVTVRAADPRGSSGSVRFRWIVSGLPSVSHTSLARAPRLAFTVSAGKDAPKLRKLVIGLPRGLSFSRRGGVSLRGPSGHKVRGALKVSGGRLVISLASGVTQIRVVIGTPRLVAGRLRTGRRSVTLRLTDLSGQTTALKFRVRAS